VFSFTGGGMKSNKIEHPTICFGISRHNDIIPLKIVEVTDYEDGCYRYVFDINHPKPTDYMKCHQKASFTDVFVSADRPLHDKYSKIHLTLESAKEAITRNLTLERSSAMAKINSIDKRLDKINNEVNELQLAINLPE
jgi:hypothetical protein